MEALAIVLAPALGLLFFLWISNRNKPVVGSSREQGEKPQPKWERPEAQLAAKELERPTFKRAAAEGLLPIEASAPEKQENAESPQFEESEEGKGVSGLNLSFKELVRRFTDPSGYRQHKQERKAADDIIDPLEAIKLAKAELGASTDRSETKKRYYEGGLEQITANAQGFTSAIKDEEDRKRAMAMREQEKRPKPAQKKPHKLFKRKRAFVEAIIMKEVLESPRHF